MGRALHFGAQGQSMIIHIRPGFRFIDAWMKRN